MTYAVIYHTPDGVHQITVEADMVRLDGMVAVFIAGDAAKQRYVAAFYLDGIIGYFENPDGEEMVH